MSICIDLTIEPNMNVHIDMTAKIPKVTPVHSCSICMGMMDTPFWLGCHVFCKTCIADWVHNSATCPTCRVEIPEEMVRQLIPRRSGRASKATVMFTTDGTSSSTVTSHEMMERVENLE